MPERVLPLLLIAVSIVTVPSRVSPEICVVTTVWVSPFDKVLTTVPGVPFDDVIVDTVSVVVSVPSALVTVLAIVVAI